MMSDTRASSSLESSSSASSGGSGPVVEEDESSLQEWIDVKLEQSEMKTRDLCNFGRPVQTIQCRKPSLV